MTSRIILFFTFYLVLVAGLFLRAFFIQVLPHPQLAHMQKRQYTTTISLPPHRGNILDRNGEELASSVATESLFVDPLIIEKRKSTARKISKILNLSFNEVYAKINSDKRFVWIKKQLIPSQVDALKDLEIRGIGFLPDSQRTYPNGLLLSSTLGFVGQDSRGLEGLELKYDSLLRGEAQSLVSKRDAHGRPLMVSGQIFEAALEGADVVLTIDKNLQYELEYELQKVVTAQKAAGATGVILDPQSGEILAMASLPHFDPNEYKSFAPDQRKNRAVTDIFEPGSTFKTIVAAAALKTGRILPNTKYFCENGKFQIGKRIIRESENKHKFGWITLSEILQVSSNIGSTKVAYDIGQGFFRQAISDFGFGQKTGVDLPGESAGIVNPEKNWSEHLQANVSFGHGIGVTALQVARAYAAIANGGKLLKPYIVSRVVDREGQTIEKHEPEVVREVLSKTQASMTTMMLMGVTEEGGTGVSARVDGYPVAGKTGTAQKVDPNGRGYKKDSYVSSFAGFVPANNPQFVIYIVVDEPKKEYYGAQVAAPVFQRLASSALRKKGFMPIVVAEGEGPLRNLDARFQKLVTPLQVLALPKPLSPTQMASQWIEAQSDIAPNLSGLTLREVVDELRKHNMESELIGTGRVVSQRPEANQKLSPGGKLRVYFRSQ